METIYFSEIDVASPSHDLGANEVIDNLSSSDELVKSLGRFSQKNLILEMRALNNQGHKLKLSGKKEEIIQRLLPFSSSVIRNLEDKLKAGHIITVPERAPTQKTNPEKNVRQL